jgi:hypothetical protein
MRPMLSTETLLIQLFNLTSTTTNSLYQTHTYLSSYSSPDSTTRIGPSLPAHGID